MKEMMGNIAQYIEEFMTYEPVGVNVSLVESGLIDSTSIFDLIQHLEETYNITIDDEEIDPENFDTVEKIATFVTSKQERAQ